MRKRRRILYQICGIFLGISCMLSACHEKEETFTSVAVAEADAGDKKNEAESKAAEEKPDKVKEIRVDYKKAAVLGEVLIPRVTKTGEDEWTIVLAGEDKEIRAVVWLKYEEA